MPPTAVPSQQAARRTPGATAGAAFGTVLAATRGHPRLVWAAVLLGAYAALTVAVVVGSPLDELDSAVARWHLFQHSGDIRYAISLLVLTGQRVPAALAVGGYVAWRAWQQRDWQPVTLFAVALLALNLSVAAVKYSTGRLGPRVTDQAHDVLAGGTIFPSGHASNAVVMFGVVAMLTPAVHRRTAWWLAGAAAAVVGLGTVVVDTHWVTDVVGAWLAGALVLLALPVLTPPTHRFIGGQLERLRRWAAVRWSGRRPGRAFGDRSAYRSAIAGITSRPRRSSGVIVDTLATVPCTSDTPRPPRPRSRSMRSGTFSPCSPGSRGSITVFSIES